MQSARSIHTLLWICLGSSVLAQEPARRPDVNSCISDTRPTTGGVRLKNNCAYPVLAAVKMSRKGSDGYTVRVEILAPGDHHSTYYSIGGYDLTSCKEGVSGCNWDWLIYLQACKRWPDALKPESEWLGSLSYALPGDKVTDVERSGFNREYGEARRRYLIESILPMRSGDTQKINQCAVGAETELEKVRARLAAKWTK